MAAAAVANQVATSAVRRNMPVMVLGRLAVDRRDGRPAGSCAPRRRQTLP